MAGLDGRIEIGIDYRPCIVHIPEKATSYRMSNGEIVKEPEEKHKGLFHCWSHRSELVGESPMRGGHPGGQIAATFGLAEYEDGTMHEVKPQNIRFVDCRIKQYGFWEEEDVSKCED